MIEKYLDFLDIPTDERSEELKEGLSKTYGFAKFKVYHEGNLLLEKTGINRFFLKFIGEISIFIDKVWKILKF